MKLNFSTILSRYFPWIVLISIIPLLIYLELGTWIINHDASVKLYITQHKFLFGRQLYTEFLEHGPPYLYIPFDIIYGLFKLSFTNDLGKFYLSFLALNIGMVVAYSRRIVAIDNLQQKAVDYFFITCLILLIFFPGENWGQKEHIALTWLLPYLTYRFCSSNQLSVSSQILIGVLLSFSLMIRPNFLAIICGVELYRVIFRKKHTLKSFLAPLLITTISTFVLATIYIIISYNKLQIMHLFSFITEELEGSRSLFYQSYVDILLRYIPFLLCTVGTLITVIFRRMKRIRSNRLLTYLLTINISSLLCAIFFKTDWTYRYIPFHVTSILLLFVVLYMTYKKIMPSLNLSIVKTALYVLVITIPLYSLHNKTELPSIFQDLNSSKKKAKFLIEIIKRHSNRYDHTAFFSTVIHPKFPVILIAKQKMTSKYLAFESLANQYETDLPSLISGKFHQVDHLTLIEQDIHNDILKNLTANQPKVIIIDHYNAPVYDFNLRKYLYSYKYFRDIFSQYEQIDSKDFDMTILIKRSMGDSSSEKPTFPKAAI